MNKIARKIIPVVIGDGGKFVQGWDLKSVQVSKKLRKMRIFEKHKENYTFTD